MMNSPDLCGLPCAIKDLAGYLWDRG